MTRSSSADLEEVLDHLTALVEDARALPMSSSCVVHAEGATVVLYGVSGMLVVSRPGLTFVTTLDRATELNPLLDQLPDTLAGRTQRRPEL